MEDYISLYPRVLSEADPEGTSLPETLLCRDEENKELKVGQSAICVLALPFLSPMTLAEMLNLSGPQFPCL